MADAKAKELTPVEHMIRIMDLEGSSVDVTRVQDIANQVAERILAADNVEDVFAAAELGLETSEAMLNIPQMIVNVTYNKSGFQGSLPVYSVVTSVDADGVEHTWGVGAPSAQTQLFKWSQLEAIPGIVVVLVSKESRTNPGNSVLLFRRPTPAEEKTFKG